ncbi:NAD(P)-binding protein [Bimuria novae-zelandiae CBS 107.79]|uniref:NAD(P)-binding protein n=1 Tax=Bimuria novae-zelandiae CBS 107.79 TaxID=1447943 RepID=A0A6A5VNU1_9PLEO|nr:NAD(P)-binding protein [Bimuria novae-zelandiae CBS 107.79]
MGSEKLQTPALATTSWELELIRARLSRVAIAGAGGYTRSSIVNALLATPEKYEVTALTRPESVTTLSGIDVVISCMTILQMQEEFALIEASKAAGVGRYVPSFFGPCSPPRGVLMPVEMKGKMLDHVRSLYLPYTVIDIGWWYQLFLPSLPSGTIKVQRETSIARIIGDGNTPWALTDNRDIGKFVAKMIADPRILNKPNEVWEIFEKVSGESVPREYVTKEELHKNIKEGQAAIAENPMDVSVMLPLVTAQYRDLLGVQGFNTPEYAKYLGYLDARELYPDLVLMPFEEYVKDAFYGRTKAGYSSFSSLS